MSIVIFGVGLFVFFLTVYGTVVAGGLMLTKEQIEENPEFAPEGSGDGANPHISPADVIRAKF